MTTTKQVPQVVLDLQRAREILVEYGWAQGCYGSGRSSHCLVGAILDAVDDRQQTVDVLLGNLSPRIQRAVSAIIDPHWTGHADIYSTVTHWNDEKMRTFKEVLDVLDRAIAAELGAQIIMK